MTMIFVQAIKYVAFLGLFCAISVQSLHAQQTRKLERLLVLRTREKALGATKRFYHPNHYRHVLCGG